MKQCYRCGEEWTGKVSQPGRQETCLSCGADLHCCKNCKLYASSMANQCMSRTTDPVGDKEKRNFCDEFDFSSKSFTPGQGMGGGKKNVLGEVKQIGWDDLFKKS